MDSPNPNVKFAVGWIALAPLLGLVFFSPDILGDYFRVATFAGVAVIVWMSLELGFTHQAAWRSSEAFRAHHYPPRIVWTMALGYLFLTIPAMALVLEQFGEPIKLYGLPPLALSTGCVAAFEGFLLRRHRAVAAAAVRG